MKKELSLRVYVVIAALAWEAADKAAALLALEDGDFLAKRFPSMSEDEINAAYEYIENHSWKEIQSI